MKKYLLISGLIMAAILLQSCPMPLIDIDQVEPITEESEIIQQDPPASETEETGEQDDGIEPAPIETVTPGITTDIERNQGIYINEQNEKIDIRSTEGGITVACVEAVDIVFLEAPNIEVSENDRTRAIALVIGRRDDGNPGLWEIHNDDSIHPLKIEGKETSMLPESEEYQDWMMAAFGWKYYVTGISSDGRIVIGYAENNGGWEHPHWNIKEETTVGVYWNLGKNNSGRIPWVSRAKVIGTPLNSFDWKFGSDKFGRIAMRWLRFLRKRFQLLFLDWMENYLTTAVSVNLAEEEGQYIIKGPDKDGIDSAAVVSGKKVISIEPLPTSGDELDLSPGALIPANSNAADGENLAVILTIENSGTGIVTGTFDVQFYLSDDTVFDTGDINVGTVSVTQNIPDSSAIEITSLLTIPDLKKNKCLFIYAVIDSNNSVEETDEDNNSLTPDAAPAILVYDDENDLRNYSLSIETFPATGTVDTNPDTWLFLYDDTTREDLSDYLNENDNGGTFLTDNYSGLGETLTPGIYYVLVMGTASGPYALSVRLSGDDIRFFEDELTSDPYEDDDSYYGHIPNSPAPVSVGGAVNRYCGSSSDFDWFRIVLP
ncbi:MAG: hypothetical protein JEZ04_05930 [Spirochaetales bacterium]|nr:hypothetical protein [Spirochaetales bacterium]